MFIGSNIRPGGTTTIFLQQQQQQWRAARNSSDVSSFVCKHRCLAPDRVSAVRPRSPQRWPEPSPPIIISIRDMFSLISSMAFLQSSFVRPCMVVKSVRNSTFDHSSIIHWTLNDQGFMVKVNTQYLQSTYYLLTQILNLQIPSLCFLCQLIEMPDCTGPWELLKFKQQP